MWIFKSIKSLMCECMNGWMGECMKWEVWEYQVAKIVKTYVIYNPKKELFTTLINPTKN